MFITISVLFNFPLVTNCYNRLKSINLINQRLIKLKKEIESGKSFNSLSNTYHIGHRLMIDLAQGRSIYDKR